MRKAIIAVYYVIGLALTGVGLLTIFAPSRILGPEATGFVGHVTRELASGQVFAGLMVLWAARNYEKRRPVHIALVVMTGLLAFIHWKDYVDHPGSVGYALANTMPFVLLLMTTPSSSRGGSGAR